MNLWGAFRRLVASKKLIFVQSLGWIALEECRQWRENFLFKRKNLVRSILLHLVYGQEQRSEAEWLLVLISKRMKKRMSQHEQAKAWEDSSQLQSYRRVTNVSESSTNKSHLSIELVEHEKDLRTHDLAQHECTLVFSKLLKMGESARGGLKKTAKFSAYEKLKALTREAARENLLIDLTRDGLWKAVIRPSMDQWMTTACVIWNGRKK